MSYEIVKGIKVENGKVWLKADSNNVSPRCFKWRESSYCTDILQKHGQQALDLSLLHGYQGGTLQPGTPNKYSRAVDRLRHMPEYAPFDWRNRPGDVTWQQQDAYKKEHSKEYDALLLKALHTKYPADKFAVTKAGYSGETLYGRVRRRSIQWWPCKDKATTYHYKADAESLKFCYTNSEAWQVVQLI